MFREMRRKKQELSKERSVSALKEGITGVLAVIGDDDYPYTVPLNYVYNDEKVYLHCATEGHKLDAIKKNAKVSFCVIDKDTVIPEEYNTHFRSVIVFGRARVLDNPDEKRKAFQYIAEKYSPNEDTHDKQIDGFFNQTAAVEITVEHMTGKEAEELA